MSTEDFNKSADDGGRDYMRRVRDLRREKRYPEAEELVDEGLLTFPKNPFLLQAKGHAFRTRWQDTEALKVFEEAHHILPRHPFIASDYASMLFKTKSFTEAETVLLGIIAPLWETKEDLRGLSYSLFTLGHIYQSDRYFQYATDCFWGALQGIPSDYKTQGRYDEMYRKHRLTSNPEKWAVFERHMKDVVTQTSTATAMPSSEPSLSL